MAEENAGVDEGRVAFHQRIDLRATLIVQDFPDNGDFASDESGVGTIETVLILVVLISLVLIFQTQMRSIINNVFKTINSGVNEVKLK